jgi:rod shape-determining protein MreC
VLDFDGSKKTRRRDIALSGVVLLLALLILILPAAYQQPIRNAFRATLLRPFIAAQAQLAERRGRTVDVGAVRAQRDSLAALVAAQGSLSEENRQLRSTVGLRARLQESFRSANVLQLGTAGAESTFLIDIGAAEGVREGSPIITPDGLLGVVWEVKDHIAQAIDWTHPQFVVSAMTATGGAYGLVEARRGRFREEDVLVLTGAPFHTDIQPGTRVVTSGRGALFPRGVMIGTILGIEDADTGWRKSYLIRPAVRPEAASQVLVGISAAGDLSDVWHVAAPADPALRDTTIANAAERDAQ